MSQRGPPSHHLRLSGAVAAATAGGHWEDQPPKAGRLPVWRWAVCGLGPQPRDDRDLLAQRSISSLSILDGSVTVLLDTNIAARLTASVRLGVVVFWLMRRRRCP